jgi:hypothetical protein
MRTILAFTILFAGGTAQARVEVGMCERNATTNKYKSSFIENLTGQLETSQDPILELYRQQRDSPPNTKVTGVSGHVGDLKQAAVGALATEAFPQNCINASMLSHSVTDSYYCPDSSQKKQKVMVQKEAKCVSQEQVDYTHWLINKVYSCFNDPQNPLDPRMIFLKMNNESGFDHTLCSTAGCGMGQLTPIAIEQLGKLKGIEHFVPPEIEKTFRGNPLKQGCEKFTELLYPEKKRLNRYSGYNSSSTATKCRLLHPGQGAALNAMYSLGYLKYLTRRDGELKDSLALIDNKRAEVKAKLLTAGFKYEIAQGVARINPNNKNVNSLEVLKAEFTRLQEQDAELDDPRWEQQLLMAAYNQGSGGAGAQAVDGEIELERARKDKKTYKVGVYKSLKAALNKTGQGKSPIHGYMDSVAARLKYVAPNQDPFTKEVFEEKREQVNINAADYGLNQCSLSTDQQNIRQKPVPLGPIAGSKVVRVGSASLQNSKDMFAVTFGVGMILATNLIQKKRAPANAKPQKGSN